MLRAIDPQTGNIAWEVPQIGDASSWGGVLSTAGGVVFYADDAGAIAAVTATTGAPLWHFHTNELLKASPMTYAAHGKQYRGRRGRVADYRLRAAVAIAIRCCTIGLHC